MLDSDVRVNYLMPFFFCFIFLKQGSFLNKDLGTILHVKGGARRDIKDRDRNYLFVLFQSREEWAGKGGFKVKNQSQQLLKLCD